MNTNTRQSDKLESPLGLEQQQVDKKHSQSEDPSEKDAQVEISSVEADPIPNQPDIENDPQPEVPENPPQEPAPATAQFSVESLSLEDRTNLQLVTTIQYLVLVQPLTGLATVLLGTAVLAIFQLEGWQHFTVVFLGILAAAIFASVEIRLVSRLIKSDLSSALLYNVTNKLLYMGSTALLVWVSSNPTATTPMMLFVGTHLLHGAFFVCALWYRKKWEIDQYVARPELTQLLSILNPLLIVQSASLGAVMYYGRQVSYWVAALPTLVFCGGYGLLCAYSVWKLGEALKDAEEFEGEEKRLFVVQSRIPGLDSFWV